MATTKCRHGRETDKLLVLMLMAATIAAMAAGPAKGVSFKVHGDYEAKRSAAMAAKLTSFAAMAKLVDAQH